MPFDINIFTGVGADPESVESIVGSQDRWTPIVANLVINNDLWITYTVGNNRTVIYDPDDGFVAWFIERSSIEIVGDVMIVTILPNGGWSSSSFSIKFISGLEVT